jgi:threonine dehydrogenase-like Zn-dependent dehydrogenase
VSFDDGAMLSGVMMGMNIFEKLRPEPGETTLVIGAGAMGWPQIQLARHFQTRVIAIGRGARRLEICHDLGAQTVIDQSATDDLLATIGAAAPNGVQCVVETTCSDWGVSLSIDAAGAGGRIAWIGGPAIPLNPWQLTGRELAIFGIKAGHHQHQAIDLVASGRVDLKPSITHRLPLEEVPLAFDMLSGPDRGDVGRIIIEHDR